MNKNFLFMALFAFAAVICFFSINSYWADTHHANRALLIVGIALACGGAIFLYRTIKTSN